MPLLHVVCLKLNSMLQLEETESILKPMEMVNDLYDTNEKVIQTVTGSIQHG
jgi:hypothetical protein